MSIREIVYTNRTLSNKFNLALVALISTFNQFAP